MPYCQVWIFSFSYVVGHSQHVASVSDVSWMPCLGTVHPRNILAKKQEKFGKNLQFVAESM